MRLSASAGSLWGGDFSTGEMGNFHPALTDSRAAIINDDNRLFINWLNVIVI
jgi:hypothetical protein